MALLFFGVIGYCLYRTGGQYVEPFLLAFVAAWLVYSVRFFQRAMRGSSIGENTPYFILIFFLACLVQKPFLLYAISGAALWTVHGALWTALFFSIVLTVGHFRHREKVWRASFLLVVTALIIARLATLIASPQPDIDVFSKTRLALEYLLAGENPYTQIYPIPYDGKFGDYTGFPYLPGVLYWTFPFHWLLGDLRFGYLVADVGAAAVLFALGRIKKMSAHSAGMMAVLWLAFPVSLLILEQAWIDTLLLFIVGASMLAMSYRRFLLAGVLAGVAVATKQYALFIPLLLIWWLFTAKAERRASVKMACGMVVTSILFLLPFLIADPEQFLFNTVGAFRDLAMRPDSFSLLSWFHHRFALDFPSWISGLLYGASLFLVLWKVRQRQTPDSPVEGMVVLYGVIFLFGKQAFCNYYQLLSYLVLAGILLAGLVTVDSARGGILRR